MDEDAAAPSSPRRSGSLSRSPRGCGVPRRSRSRRPASRRSRGPRRAERASEEALWDSSRREDVPHLLDSLRDFRNFSPACAGTPLMPPATRGSPRGVPRRVSRQRVRHASARGRGCVGTNAPLFEGLPPVPLPVPRMFPRAALPLRHRHRLGATAALVGANALAGAARRFCPALHPLSPRGCRAAHESLAAVLTQIAPAAGEAPRVELDDVERVLALDEGDAEPGKAQRTRGSSPVGAATSSARCAASASP